MGFFFYSKVCPSVFCGSSWFPYQGVHFPLLASPSGVDLLGVFFHIGGFFVFFVLCTPSGNIVGEIFELGYVLL